MPAHSNYIAHFRTRLGTERKRFIRAQHLTHARAIALGVARANRWRVVEVCHA